MQPLCIPIDQERIAAFCRQWRVKELSLFGAVLRGDLRPDSDVDVLVDLLPDHGLTLYDWIDMIQALEDIFGRKVDLVSKKGIRNPIRKQEILGAAEVIYAA